MRMMLAPNMRLVRRCQPRALWLTLAEQSGEIPHHRTRSTNVVEQQQVSIVSGGTTMRPNHISSRATVTLDPDCWQHVVGKALLPCLAANCWLLVARFVDLPG